MTKGYIYNPGAPGPTMLERGSLVNSNGNSSRFADHIIKFKLTLPNYRYLIQPQYKLLYDEYAKKGPDLGVSFTLYALIQSLDESVEQAVTNKRSKGGFVENHWGPRPSVVTASGIVGTGLSAFGLTSFQVENTKNETETVLYWDPTTNVALIDPTMAQKAPAGKNPNWLGQQFQNMSSSMARAVGMDYSLSTVDKTNSNQSSLPTVSSSSAALTGTNLGFRKFRMILDLFKMNGVVFDSIPNPDIYPYTYVAGEAFVDSDGVQHTTQSLVEGGTLTGENQQTLNNEYIAPGNVRAVLPIEMWVKNTLYTGFFESFNYQLSEDSPFSANYDFTFRAQSTRRTAVFFPDGTAGKKPYSLIIDPNKTPWSR